MGSLKDAEKFQRLLNVVELFREENPRIELQTIKVFSTICQELELREKDGRTLSIGEVCDIVGISKSSASRNVAFLTAHGDSYIRSKGGEGFNWIKLEHCPEHLSRKNITLTEKGMKVRDKITELFMG